VHSVVVDPTTIVGMTVVVEMTDTAVTGRIVATTADTVDAHVLVLRVGTGGVLALLRGTMTVGARPHAVIMMTGVVEEDTTTAVTIEGANALVATTTSAAAMTARRNA
jgi:hypothetical protein